MWMVLERRGLYKVRTFESLRVTVKLIADELFLSLIPMKNKRCLYYPAIVSRKLVRTFNHVSMNH